MTRVALVLVLAVVAGCMHPITATSLDVLPAAATTMVVPHSLPESEQLVIEKLSARGFALVERQATAARAALRFAGNRDFFGTDTLGSVFYATLEPTATRGRTQLTLVGRPSIGHVVACGGMASAPRFANDDCMPLARANDWGLTGREEANVIRGVFAELDLDAELSVAARP